MRIKFYLKDPKSSGETAVFASISYSGMRLKYYLPEISINPKFWDSKKQESKSGGKFITSPEFNNKLKKRYTQINDVYERLRSLGIPKMEDLRQELNSVFGVNKNSRLDFFAFADDFILRTANGQRIARDGKRINPKSAYGMNQMLEKLKAFNKFSKCRVCFENFDQDFYTSFTNYLNSEKESLNTVGKRIKDLKTILNAALDKKLTDKNDFQRWKVAKEEVFNIALSEVELKSIEDLDLSDKHIGLQHTRDLFVICCHTGLRHSDASRLNDYFTIKDGFLYGDQKKTGNGVVLPIHPSVKKILQQYNGSFPKSSANQVENRNLKVIANMVDEMRDTLENKARTIGGVKIYTKKSRAEMLCTHSGRRTFATLAYKSGLPTISIMAMTGHRTEKSFLGYLKISQKEHAAIVANYWANENNLKIV